MRKNVFICVPTYNGTIDAKTALSLLQNVTSIIADGNGVTFDLQLGNCYIAAARNNGVDNFMKTDCTDMVFVDADLSFGPDAMRKLLSHDVDIVGGVYPYRGGSGGWPCSIITNQDRTPHCINGLIEAKHIPTGFMRIRRSVIEKMKTLRPELKRNDGMPTLFDTGNLWGNGEWYGEDVAFCKRWREIGGEIWIEPHIDFLHIGKSEHAGNYHEYLLSLPKPENK